MHGQKNIKFNFLIKYIFMAVQKEACKSGKLRVGWKRTKEGKMQQWERLGERSRQ